MQLADPVPLQLYVPPSSASLSFLFFWWSLLTRPGEKLFDVTTLLPVFFSLLPFDTMHSVPRCPSLFQWLRNQPLERYWIELISRRLAGSHSDVPAFICSSRAVQFLLDPGRIDDSSLVRLKFFPRCFSPSPPSPVVLIYLVKPVGRGTVLISARRSISTVF